MLTDILTKDVVRLDVEGLTTPEEVIHFSGQLLVNSGKVKEMCLSPASASSGSKNLCRFITPLMIR